MEEKIDENVYRQMEELVNRQLELLTRQKKELLEKKEYLISSLKKQTSESSEIAREIEDMYNKMSYEIFQKRNQKNSVKAEYETKFNKYQEEFDDFKNKIEGLKSQIIGSE